MVIWVLNMPVSLRYIPWIQQSFGQVPVETCGHSVVLPFKDVPRTETIMAITVATEDLMADLRALVAEMEALLQEGGAKLKERLGEAGSALESDLAHAKKRLADLQRDARVTVRRTARSVDRYAHDNPWQMTGASLATGLLLGLALGLVISGRRG
jgi:ElaB/YqjD/DUF883 family membrane-anchored ribosome-binding protein